MRSKTFGDDSGISPNRSPLLIVLGFKGRGWRTSSGSGRIYGRPNPSTPLIVTQSVRVIGGLIHRLSCSSRRCSEGKRRGNPLSKSLWRRWLGEEGGEVQGREARRRIGKDGVGEVGTTSFRLRRRLHNSSTSRRHRTVSTPTSQRRHTCPSRTRLPSTGSWRARDPEVEACRAEAVGDSSSLPGSPRCRSQIKPKLPERLSVKSPKLLQ